MRLRQYAFAAVALGALHGGPVFAAGPSPAPVPAKATQVSMQEKQVRSVEYLRQMRGSLKVVLAKLDEARASKDVIKLNCVNEKLANIKGLLRISEQADLSLQEAVAKKEEQGADHEFARLTIAQQKVEQLRAEAEQCVGMLAFETGPTEVAVDEPDLPDPTVAPPPAPPVTRPLPASPVQ